ncbi:hypothetical protein HY570_03545, partial [Candidatus Micrarchaeota archaeon]|nr:hypothetical protein [Candidatus Micrarchaeota archaeon]
LNSEIEEGDKILAIVKNNDKLVTNAPIIITPPSNNSVSIKTNELGVLEFSPTLTGPYKFTIKENNFSTTKEINVTEPFTKKESVEGNSEQLLSTVAVILSAILILVLVLRK